ncbi:MAG: IclR family transcriptional regulator [Pseudomonadota bacterium]
MTKTTMSTVDKALTLLRYFSVQNPELGLSELARLSGYDKTTTLRCMTALARNGFVEQDAESRKYRVGLAPVNLAQIREQSFPVRSVIARHLEGLSSSLGETAHGSLVMGHGILTAGISFPERALFVHIDPSETLPHHATASGFAILAHADPTELEQYWGQAEFETFTDNTPVARAEIEPLLAECRAQGVARAASTFEADVIGTAAPIFGQLGPPIGTIAVAAVASRVTPDLQARIDTSLKTAAKAITNELGGRPPSNPFP